MHKPEIQAVVTHNTCAKSFFAIKHSIHISCPLSPSVYLYATHVGHVRLSQGCVGSQGVEAVTEDGTGLFPLGPL